MYYFLVFIKNVTDMITTYPIVSKTVEPASRLRVSEVQAKRPRRVNYTRILLGFTQLAMLSAGFKVS